MEEEDIGSCVTEYDAGKQQSITVLPSLYFSLMYLHYK